MSFHVSYASLMKLKDQLSELPNITDISIDNVDFVENEELPYVISLTYYCNSRDDVLKSINEFCQTFELQHKLALEDSGDGVETMMIELISGSDECIGPGRRRRNPPASRKLQKGCKGAVELRTQYCSIHFS
jgi:hypothetical protein